MWKTIRCHQMRPPSPRVCKHLVTSWLVYDNSLLVSLKQYTLHTLEVGQNAADHMVFKTPWLTFVTSVIRPLHWLPVHAHTMYQLATLVPRALSTEHPE